MTRPKLILAALVATFILLAGAFVLRNSGLATDPAGALAAMPSGMIFRAPSFPPGDPFTVEMTDGAARWEGHYGNVVDNMIYHFGVYEKAEVLLLRRLLRQTGGSFLDVGANIGNHSFFLARSAEAVHAIEPWPPVLERMRRQAQLNPGITNVHIHAVGYSDKPGVLPFHPPPTGFFGTGSFDATFMPPEHQGAPIPLPLVAGDQHLAQVGAGRIGVMKVDIEGYERYALEGLRQTLHRDRPAVLFELNLTKGGFNSMAQILSTFPPDYEFREIGLDPWWLLDFGVFAWFYGSEATGRCHLTPLTSFHRTNALALPKEKHLLPAPR